MMYIGIGLIVLGVLMFLYSLYYAKKQDIKNEMKEYRDLAASSDIDDSYEPPKPIDRVYEKKPINSFVNNDYERAEVLEDSTIDELVLKAEMEDDFREDTAILPEDESTAILDSETTGILDDESTDILDNESTSILPNEEIESSVVGEETEFLTENESTEILDEEIDKHVSDEQTDILENEEKTDILGDEEETDLLESD